MGVLILGVLSAIVYFSFVLLVVSSVLEDEEEQTRTVMKLFHESRLL